MVSSNKLIAKINLFIFLFMSINPSVFAAGKKRKVSRHPQSKNSSLRPCEINFVKFMNGNLPAEITGSNKFNLWDQLFEAEPLANYIVKLKTKPKRLKILKELIGFVDRDRVFTDNLSELINILYQKKILTKFDVERLFVKGEFQFARFFWSDKTKTLTSQVMIDSAKVEVVEKIIARSNLNKTRAKEYRNILLQSERSATELEVMLENGVTLYNSDKHLTQFREYFDFLNVIKPHKVNKALKGINKIYDFEYRHSFLSVGSVLPPHKEFLIQKSKIIAYEKKRLKKIMNEFKTSERKQLSEEMQKIVRRQARGEAISKSQLRKLKNRLKQVELSNTLKKRARRQAYGEKEIYRKLLNGCSGGDNPRVKKAAKKFKRFKFALALSTTPLFYITKNWDKRKSDPYFWEKLGYEMSTGLIFTFVANKIITNNSTSFFRKYLEGYIKFGAMDGVINGIGYEEMFGAHEHIRQIQRLYRPHVPESDLDLELKKLMSSPTFEKDIKELLSFLEDQSKKVNLKNWLEKLFGYGGYNTLDDNYKITKEDLESQEAREVLYELLAERMYLQNMGAWPILQSGNSGADRWMFYRMRNIAWDVKTVALNVSIFQVICRQPFGKVGSWLAVLSMIVGDSLLSGDITYGYRREAINQ